MKITTLHGEIVQIHMKLLHTQRLNIFIKYRRRYVKNDNVMLMLICTKMAERVKSTSMKKESTRVLSKNKNTI